MDSVRSIVIGTRMTKKPGDVFVPATALGYSAVRKASKNKSKGSDVSFALSLDDRSRSLHMVKAESPKCLHCHSKTYGAGPPSTRNILDSNTSWWPSLPLLAPDVSNRGARVPSQLRTTIRTCTAEVMAR